MKPRKLILTLIILLISLVIINKVGITSLSIKDPLILSAQSGIKSTLQKISILILSIILILILIILLKSKLSERKASTISKLKSYIRQELSHGKNPSEITSSLSSNYPPSDIKQALKEYLEEAIKD